MMHMTLYWGTEVTLLFDTWKTNSLPSYLLSLLACFLFSAFYQYLEDRRIKFKSISFSPNQQVVSSVNTPLLTWKKIMVVGTTARIISALVFGFNSAIGYLLMLAVMSFNGGVLLAVVAGLSVGYFVFRSGGDGVVEEEVGRVAAETTCACA